MTFCFSFHLSVLLLVFAVLATLFDQFLIYLDCPQSIPFLIAGALVLVCGLYIVFNLEYSNRF